jgi:uncharacterized protein (DUF1778 family)
VRTFVHTEERLGLRVDPRLKAIIERAAELLGIPASEFARTTLEQRAEQVVAEHDQEMRVPAAYFDELMAALNTTPTPSPALVEAMRRARTTVTRA